MPASLLQARLRSVSLLNELRDSTRLAISVAGPLAADRERLPGTGHLDMKTARDNLASLTT